MIPPILFIALAILGYSLVSKRLASTIVTAPIFFAGIGLLAGPVAGVVDVGTDDTLLVLLLEAALVMVLFADALNLDLRRWTKEPSLAGRLLGIGLPLTMIAGAMGAAVVFLGLAPWEAALIAVMLAPTDAALGQAVVANPRVPAVIRNALNVESGLNDGLALPFLTIALTIGLVELGAETEIGAVETLVRSLLGSTVIGVGAGIGGGLLIRAAVGRGYAARQTASTFLVALAVASFIVADDLGASEFLAAWTAGLATGSLIRGHFGEDTFRIPEQLADVLAAIGFLLLGAALLGPVLAAATPLTIAYALLSLTVIRMVPVAVAMLRTGFARPTVLYVGWFGPRGLASIVFAGVVVEEAIPSAEAIIQVVLLTVALSLVLHGVTAAWGARRYAAWFERAAAADPSIPEAAELPERGLRARSAPTRGAHGE